MASRLGSERVTLKGRAAGGGPSPRMAGEGGALWADTPEAAAIAARPMAIGANSFGMTGPPVPQLRRGRGRAHGLLLDACLA